MACRWDICTCGRITALVFVGIIQIIDAYTSIYDLNQICVKQPSFKVDISPSHPATFRLNVTSTEITSKKRLDRHFVFSCFFSVKPRRLGSNTSLDIEWQNLGNGCTDYVQIIKSDENLIVYFEGSGKHFLTLTGASSVDMHLSVCKMSTPDHFLQIKAMTSSPPGESTTDISSIVLAFLAPFAFILLAVILAVMGSCCCSRKCGNQNPSVEIGTSCTPSEAGIGSTTTSQPSGSRDTLFTVASLVDKPPSYEDLFPTGYIYDETALDKLHNKPGGSRSVVTSSSQSDTALVASNNSTGGIGESNGGTGTGTERRQASLDSGLPISEFEIDVVHLNEMVVVV